MKIAIHLSVWLLIATSAPLASGRTQSYDPAANNHAHRRQGFTDFLLGQINPQNTDYGCEIEEARKVVVDETIRNIDFWIVSVALVFLILSFLTLLIQKRERNQLEILASRFLAQYHNSLIDARSQAQTAIKRYNELVSATDRVAEKVHTCQPIEPQAATSGSEAIHSAQPRSTTAIAIKSNGPRNEAGASESVVTQTLPRLNHTSDVDLLTQLKKLRQQLTASHEREKNLKNELSKMRRDVEMNQTAKT